MFVQQIATANAHYGLRLEWTPVTDPDFSHYSVHMSKTSGMNYQHIADVTDPSYFIPVVEPGTYYFIVYAHDINGNYSIASDEVTFIR